MIVPADIRDGGASSFVVEKAVEATRALQNREPWQEEI